MALQNSYTPQSGIELPEAYLRIDNNSIAVTHETMTFAVMAYASAQARADGAPPVEPGRFYTAPWDLETPNPFAQAYGWLKSGVPAQGQEGEEGYAPAVPGPYPAATDA